jgi:lysophospholipase L1-like esterase
MKRKEEKKHATTEKKQSPKWFYAVMISLPILFFVILELSLRIIGYGLDYTQFKTISSYYPDKLFLNPDLPYKYFYNINQAPSTLPDGFDKVKKDNAFRVFVMGGSSAAGWPYVPNASFSRQLKRRLELLYPDSNIEVINLGISAINTYTIRDFMPEVLEQSPDLILIYAGHNEYYGALGVGSTVSFGLPRSLVNTYIWLKEFKTTDLLQDIISSMYSLLETPEEIKMNNPSETLMSRMIGESTIPYQSELYFSGINQFEGNFIDILQMCKGANVNVIIGNLTANTLDLKPFVSVQLETFASAEEIFYLAKMKLGEGKIKEADSLFSFAMELDALRFRAPNKINRTIEILSDQLKIPFANIDSIFRANSKFNIVGYNLTVDHLHPNIEGYKLIAKAFFQKMEELNYLPGGRKIQLSLQEQDSLLASNFPFTKLDSTFAEMRIILLTGQYPFVPKGTPNFRMKNYKMTSFVDTLSMQIFNREVKWETAHSILAEHYLKKNDIKSFIREIDVIIQERPYFDQPYEYLTKTLIDSGYVDYAMPYLIKLHSFKPGYFTYKWLGQIYLHNKNYSKSLPYLQKAVSFPEADYQVWYNLSGSYYFNNETDNAIDAVEKSLSLNPQNPLARELYNQLKSLK